MAKEELDRVLDRIPSGPVKNIAPNAVVVMNVDGSLGIYLLTGGYLELPEKQLNYLIGDDVID